MHPNIENEFKSIQSQVSILEALRRKGSLSFTEILEEAKISTRTLSKHLFRLAECGTIERLGRLYSLSSLGLDRLRILKAQLRAFKRYQKSDSTLDSIRSGKEYAVQVDVVKPSGDLSLGLFRIVLPRMLKIAERQDMDKALTQAIHTVLKAIPTGSKSYRIEISGAQNQDNHREARSFEREAKRIGQY